MKKQLKKVILSGILSLTMFLSCANGVQASTFSVEEQIREEVLEEYRDDPEFKCLLEADEELAMEYIDSIVEERLEEMRDSKSRATESDGSRAYCKVPVIKQTTTTNCSAATLLQTLYGLGKAGNVVGNTDAKKMATLYNFRTNSSAPGARINSPANTSLYVSEIVTYLNTQVSTYKYKFTLGSELTLSEFKSLIWNSLVHNRPVMLHAKTGYLTYYNSKNLRHYLSLDSYNRNNETIRIKDCHYSDTYGGSHAKIPVKEAYYTISKESGRYLISD